MTKTIEQLDKNFAFNTTIDEDILRIVNGYESPLSLHGVIYDGEYRRMSAQIAQKVSENTVSLCKNTAGGRVRFRTNSRCITIRCEMDFIDHVPHMPLTGTAGCDLYSNNEFCHTFAPSWKENHGYSGIHWFEDNVMRDITINLPLYNGVRNFHIGIEKDAALLPPTPYTISSPIVSYGSSITQGGCASRPGRSYQSIISRELDADYVNLGFSGSALGEKQMAHYIASLDMSAFIYDYDCNAPSVEHLRNTHTPFYEIVRNAHPDIPIIMLSRPYCGKEKKWLERRNVVFESYQNALKSGDKNVYFIDGLTLIDSFECTVDLTHPNDYGFVCMANKITSKLKEAFSNGG